jgi:phosphoglycerate dehydrogenase-like enzyme
MRTVATFANPAEAHLLAAHLGGNGIEAVLRDENTVQADILLTNAVGGVKVDVAEADYAAALAIVRSIAAERAAERPPVAKRKHKAGRYYRAFGVLLVVMLALSEWFLGWRDHGVAFGCSLMIAAGCSAFLALCDL